MIVSYKCLSGHIQTSRREYSETEPSGARQEPTRSQMSETYFLTERFSLDQCVPLIHKQLQSRALDNL